MPNCVWTTWRQMPPTVIISKMKGDKLKSKKDINKCGRCHKPLPVNITKGETKKKFKKRAIQAGCRISSNKGEICIICPDCYDTQIRRSSL